MANYRVHYKKGDVEIEVESTDKDYVDTMLKKLVTMEPTSSKSTKDQSSAKKGKGGKRPKTKSSKKVEVSEESELDIPSLVAKIHDDDNFAAIEEHILNKHGQLQRVLLILFFAKEMGSEHLTSGQISAVTNELGVNLSQANVSRTLSDKRKFFTAGTVRKKGAKVLYKLNRQGIKAFEKCLRGEKV